MRPSKKPTLQDLVQAAQAEGVKVTCSLQPETAIRQKQAKEARRYCAIKLMHEAHRQAKLAARFREDKLEQGSSICQHSAWAFHLAAAFLLAAEEAGDCS